MVRALEKELLSAEDVAGLMGVKETTVWRWCREGNLPCLKVGKHWRVRREALEEFLRRSERPTSLVEQLSSFLQVPDNVFAIAQDLALLHRLDAAFFQVGEAHGGKLAKFCGPESGASVEELRAELGRVGLDVERLEGEGRLRFVAKEKDEDHVQALRRFCEEEAEEGRTFWVSFNWVVGVDLEEALERQRELTRYVADRQLVVQTSVLEGDTDEWPLPLGREVQLVHTATVWLSEVGLATMRVSPLAEG